MSNNFKAIDAVVNIWTEEALSHRPGWRDNVRISYLELWQRLRGYAAYLHERGIRAGRRPAFYRRRRKGGSDKSGRLVLSRRPGRKT